MSTAAPPSDLEAEAAVISSAMLSSDARDEALTLLRPEHFFADKHARVWETIVALTEAERKVDIVTISGHLKASGRLDQIGGTPYLAQLIDATPAVSHVEEHAQTVRDMWRRRQLIEACRTALSECHGTKSVESLVSDHAATLDGVLEARTLNTQTTLKSALRAEVEAYERRSRTTGYVPGIPTGIHELDRKIGGLGRGNLYIVAARPGAGKTGLAVTLARNVARGGYGVVFLSLEMPRDQLAQRAAAQEGGLDTKEINEGRLTAVNFAVYSSAIRKCAELPIVIDDDAKQTPASLRSATRRAVRRLQAEHDASRLGLIIVDYLQLMEDDGPSGRNRTREEEVRKMSTACRKLAKEFNVPVVALSQLNRAVESRPDKRPQLSDLRESGAIEQDAFGVLMLYRDDYYRKPSETPDGKAEVLIRKLRQGGTTGTVECAFIGPSQAFADYQENFR